MKENLQNNTNIDFDKLRGGYYTPSLIAEFICSWAIQSENDLVLEPSCGDGNFIEAAIRRFNDLGLEGESLYGRIKGIELISHEALKASNRASLYGLNRDTIVNNDFFSFISNQANIRYNAIVGNPPFIRYQNFPPEHRDIAIKMMEDLGFKPNKLTNIWVPFLVISSSLLTKNGRLGMVIPAELFQVKYAEQTRIFLSKFFERITIVTFKKLVFDGIQQEVVLMLCEKSVTHAHGIRVLQLDDLDQLSDINFNEVSETEVVDIQHDTEKWTKYFLSPKEIDFLRAIKVSNRIPLAKNILDADVGIVTGRNEFFMLKQSQVEEWNLQDITTKVVSKSNQLSGIIFNNADFDANADKNLPNQLFLPQNVEIEKLDKNSQKYIEYGEENEFHKGYKCRIRKKWYITPSLWIPQGFALRQVHRYPKLVLNNVEASSTDTIHRLRFISEEYSPESITICFLNSLTFAFSEITGRSYGGGVMTFEPTEIEELLIPVVENHGIDVNVIDELIREDRIEEVLDIVDKKVLIDHYGFSLEETLELRNIWLKMSNRRINRGKSAKSKSKK
ncbi:Eco57I restriction-modification methylase domain-containing protein [Aequorivita vladivostokensis]|uniref:site-specific DNA-methyltransferase (adenine-specific) n=1 Tax=Aequorivita vladivostokensis TaxID=171194 RepID=A0ABR5DKK1_9FLAO|nr:class I SAM-dependent methyltransferase [Aequorivita vladivostokensis]KJJ39306.1 DNA methylase [Aequorivita vladivostokensis]